MDEKSELKRRILDTKTLPTLPGVIIELNSLADNDKACIQEMARIVSADQTLSARILRLANSPSYGFYRVSTISNAMILLGVNVVKSLAISSSIFQVMEKDSVGLWEHSLGVGVAANLLAKRINLPGGEEIATAALLHDLGKVIISLQCSAEEKMINRLVRDQKIYAIEAERQVLGTDHAEIGGLLADSWLLPENLAEPIKYHHDVARSHKHRVATSIVHVADALIKASGFGDNGDPFVPRVQQEAWEALGLDRQILADVVAELGEKLIEVKDFSHRLLGDV